MLYLWEWCQVKPNVLSFCAATLNGDVYGSTDQNSTKEKTSASKYRSNSNKLDMKKEHSNINSIFHSVLFVGLCRLDVVLFLKRILIGLVIAKFSILLAMFHEGRNLTAP